MAGWLCSSSPTLTLFVLQIKSKFLVWQDSHPSLPHQPPAKILFTPTRWVYSSLSSHTQLILVLWLLWAVSSTSLLFWIFDWIPALLEDVTIHRVPFFLSLQYREASHLLQPTRSSFHQPLQLICLQCQCVAERARAVTFPMPRSSSPLWCKPLEGRNCALLGRLCSGQSIFYNH